MTKSTAILLLMLAFLDWGSFNEIAQVNRLKTAAEEALKEEILKSHRIQQAIGRQLPSERSKCIAQPCQCLLQTRTKRSGYQSSARHS